MSRYLVLPFHVGENARSPLTLYCLALHSFLHGALGVGVEIRWCLELTKYLFVEGI